MAPRNIYKLTTLLLSFYFQNYGIDTRAWVFQGFAVYHYRFIHDCGDQINCTIDLVHGARKLDCLLTWLVNFPILANFLAVVLNHEVRILLFDAFNKKLLLLKWQHHCKHVESREKIQLLHVLEFERMFLKIVKHLLVESRYKKAFFVPDCFFNGVDLIFATIFEKCFKVFFVGYYRKLFRVVNAVGNFDRVDLWLKF